MIMCDNCKIGWLHCGSESEHDEHVWVYFASGQHDDSEGERVRCCGTESASQEADIRRYEVLWTLYSEDPATGQIGRTIALVEDGYSTVADIPKMIGIIGSVAPEEVNIVACVALA